MPGPSDVVVMLQQSVPISIMYVDVENAASLQSANLSSLPPFSVALQPGCPVRADPIAFVFQALRRQLARPRHFGSQFDSNQQKHDSNGRRARNLCRLRGWTNENSFFRDNCPVDGPCFAPLSGICRSDLVLLKNFLFWLGGRIATLWETSACYNHWRTWENRSFMSL